MTSQTLPVLRGTHRLHAEMVPGRGVPVVLMNGAGHYVQVDQPRQLAGLIAGEQG